MAHSPAAGNPVARWMADDSFRPRPPDLAVFRYKGMIWILPFFGLIAVAVGFGTLFGFKGADVAGHVIVPVVCWAVATVEWLIIVVTAVRIRAGGLVIDNMVVRHVVPWEQFAGVFVETGEGMFARLDDGSVIHSSAFGRSLGDALQRYKHMRQTLDRVREECRGARQAYGAVDPPPPCRRQLHVPWAASLGFLVFFEAASWIAFAMHGG